MGYKAAGSLSLLALAIIALGFAPSPTQAAGCPFEDASCQEYCNKQGCSLGYCGHFAWIQCICRKCGDEWNYYDKVRYNPDKTVNQTELDSLKLNGTAPLILTNSAATVDQVVPASATPSGARQLNSAGPTTTKAPARSVEKAATLTTLLIPDLSESGRIDLNDIPDENSDKFLDYLAKNHERLAQATAKSDGSSGSQDGEAGDQEDETTDSTATSTLAPADEDTIELQISTSNNNTGAQQRQQTGAGSSISEAGGVTRLLRLVATSDDALLQNEQQ